jgi:NAD(P)-dependent dehydrogenase (short-subunit alcohol dehydrogenase family)
MVGIEERVTVVTGGARGIGRVVAERLAEEGAAVRIIDVAPADETVAAIGARGGDVASTIADVTDALSIESVIGAPDWRAEVLVNVAGVFAWEDALEPERCDWDRTLRINLGGVHVCCRAAAPLMRERGFGRIVNVSSNAAVLGFRNMPSYSAAKAGIHGLTRALAADLGRFGVTVNAVAPGSIDVGMGAESGWTSDARIRAWDAGRTPLPRIGRPEDVAGAVAFLASDDAAWITGQTLVVDGGFSIAGGPDFEDFSPPLA